MNRFTRLRRAPRLAIALVVAALLGASAVAFAGLQPADLGYTPNSEGQMTNIDVARAYAKNYYGAPTAVAGSGSTATWNAPLNLDSNYAKEACSAAKDGENWLKARSKVPNRAIVLDVDDTTLTTWNYELYSNWDYNPGTNANFVGLTTTGTPPNTVTTFTGNMFPAAPCMVEMVTAAKNMGYAIFWITGRGDSQHQATIANLVSDTAAGFSDITSVAYSGKTVPEIDAGYPMPTPLDIGHGLPNSPNFEDGLFTKPSVGSYPGYLNKPEFCAAAIANNTSCATIPYKTGTRAYIESQGYDIVGDFGDQFSDLLGGYADKPFKMPNPNYYLP